MPTLLLRAVAMLTCLFAAVPGAQAFAVWQGVLVVESASGVDCAPNGIEIGTTMRMWFKPRDVGGNPSGSELVITYARGSFTMSRAVGEDLSGSGPYTGTSVLFTLGGAAIFSFVRGDNGQSNVTVFPAAFTASTPTLRITGTIGKFFSLFAAGNSTCDVTIRAHLAQQPT